MSDFVLPDKERMARLDAAAVQAMHALIPTPTYEHIGVLKRAELIAVEAYQYAVALEQQREAELTTKWPVKVFPRGFP